MEVPVFDGEIAQVKRDRAVRAGQTREASHADALDLDRTLHRIERGQELCEEVFPGRIDPPCPVVPDEALRPLP